MKSPATLSRHYRQHLACGSQITALLENRLPVILSFFPRCQSPIFFDPRSAVHQVPSYSIIASLSPLESGISLPLQDAADVEYVLPDETDELLSAGSATGSCYQSLSGKEDVFHNITGGLKNEGSNWLVSKRLEFALKESNQSSATPQLHMEVCLIKLLNTTRHHLVYIQQFKNGPEILQS